ncbi:MAG TPA: hypothetical protein VGF52_00820 [Tepidisphaeraceae bacterium]
MRRKNRIAVVVFSIFLTCAVGLGETLRVVDYNIASAASGGAPRTGLSTILQGIGNESVGGDAQPIDLLALEEVQTQATTTQDVVSLLNSTYGAGVYSRGTLNGDSTGAGTQGIVFNTHVLSLIDEKTVGTATTTGQARQTLRYEFQPIGAPASSDFYVYVSHWKAADDAADAARRNLEATVIRADADALGASAHIIYTGDYNVYRGSESAVQTMLAAGNGQANDPANQIGSWHDNASFAAIDTQAPAVTPPSALTGGGVDDRFDFQLVSNSVMNANSAGLSYISGTYHTFGNNGTTFNGSVTDASNTALAGLPDRSSVLEDLTSVTDHLPVVADYSLVVPEPVVCFELLALAILLRRFGRDSAIIHS